MPLAPGHRLGAYEILALIGAGGMGEVYRAKDARLGRNVALKVLPAGVATEPERVQRFEQEARAAAALNHPNILGVHDVGQHDGSPYMVTELLDGQTLSERLSGGALPMRKTMEYAVQIAHGLAAAHEKGIVHRDLKPDNIFVTSEGRIKILDFGLAKLTETEPTLVGVSALPTTPPHTVPGIVLGTAGYMAPEQVRGFSADHRCDIFAFGATLYEMLTGQRAFIGETPADIMSAILTKEPAPLATNDGSMSPGLERIVRHCLEKAPGERFQSARDVAFAIEGLSSGHEATVGSRSARDSIRTRQWNGLLGRAAISALAIWATVVTVAHLRESPPSAAGVVQFAVHAPEDAYFTADGDVAIPQMAVSPDGRTLAFIASGPESLGQLWIRKVESTTATPLPGTENATYPFWSPDSRWIGFFAFGKLKKIGVAGGTPVTVASAAGQARGGSWSPDGTIVFSPGNNSELWSVAAAGGKPAPATSLDTAQENSHRWPHFLPDGRHFLYTSGRNGVYVTSLDSPTPRRILTGSTNAMHDSAGYLLFVRDGALVAQRFDGDRLELTGEPSTVVDRIGFAPSTTLGAFAVSPSGVLVYAKSGGTTTQLEWFDRSGRSIGTVGEPAEYLHPRLAPDEARIAVARLDAQTGAYDIWLIDAMRSASLRFTFDSANERFPTWSPDGKWIAFASPGRQTLSDVFMKPSNGTGKDELLVSSHITKFPTDWSPDGQWLAYHEALQSTGYDLYLLDLKTRRPSVFLQTPFNELLGQFSPDGKWFAYMSDESGSYEVYVQRFPSSGDKWKVSARGGSAPRWSRNGKELFYISNDANLMTVPIAAQANLQVGVPRPLFPVRLPGVGVQYGKDYAVSADGQRFLVNTRLPTSTGSPITVILNWTQALK